MSAPIHCEPEYTVPCYREQDDQAWYHFMHGNVPGHQIDFIYRPEVPQGRLSQQHFSHLLRLIKYIEPRSGGAFAFAIGNLSRDDTQHEPGHGGVALIFGLRVRGAVDHTGRPDPPFSYAIASVDRVLDRDTLLRAALSFHRYMDIASDADSDGVALYRAYAAIAAEDRGAAAALLEGHRGALYDLPCPLPSALSQGWCADEDQQPERIVIVHADDAPFDVIARCAARIAAVLYRSNIRWTSVATGREADIANGVSIRLVPQQDVSLHRPLGALVLPIEEVPEEDSDIARKLFGAGPMERPLSAKLSSQPWRERYGEPLDQRAEAAFDEDTGVSPPLVESPRPLEDTSGVEDTIDDAPPSCVRALDIAALGAPEPPLPAPRRARLWGFMALSGVIAMGWCFLFVLFNPPKAVTEVGGVGPLRTGQTALHVLEPSPPPGIGGQQLETEGAAPFPAQKVAEPPIAAVAPPSRVSSPPAIPRPTGSGRAASSKPPPGTQGEDNVFHTEFIGAPKRPSIGPKKSQR